MSVCYEVSVGSEIVMSLLVAMLHLLLASSVLGIAKEQKQLEIEQQLSSNSSQSSTSDANQKRVVSENRLGVSYDYHMGCFLHVVRLTISAMILPGVSGSFLLLMHSGSLLSTN